MSQLQAEGKNPHAQHFGGKFSKFAKLSGNELTAGSGDTYQVCSWSKEAANRDPNEASQNRIFPNKNAACPNVSVRDKVKTRSIY